MPINWLEIGIQTAFIVALLASIGVYVRLKLIPSVLSKAEIWMGGAIGRFMQNLAKQAEEEGEGGVPGTSGTLKLGGFSVDVGTIKELLAIAPQIIQLAQMFGLVGAATGGGGGEHPFLKE